ncbi:MAG: phosphoribosylamine--glycine ligase [Pseudomonadota bacterium]|nr:phosphoribosylamine--glycine ligase [Pseudomonadota bacterium]
MPNILLVGNGAREHVLAETLARSPQRPRLFAYMKANNPGIADLSHETRLGGYGDTEAIVDLARSREVDFAVIGPEDPLHSGVVDALQTAGIPAVGPSRSLARLETSKAFTRGLLEKYGIPGNVAFRVFTSMTGVEEFLAGLREAVVKPDGLTGGKGVMVQGDHFHAKEEALAICRRMLEEHERVIVEEKVVGEEFSLQCLCDGEHVVATPPVQDHKRRFVDDKGPNTGGMGSYSCADHLLPFLRREDIMAGLEITRLVAAAIRRETGESYRGIMYGGFMITSAGLRLLEYNARLGDPEAMNILPLLETDFVALCGAIIHGALDRLPVSFSPQATVCKYIVPKGYGLPKDHPDSQSIAARIEVGDTGGARLYYSSVDQREDGLYMTTSRAIGVVGIAPDLEEAEAMAERAVTAVKGPVAHRPDIGTSALIDKRIRHMAEIRKNLP